MVAVTAWLSQCANTRMKLPAVTGLVVVVICCEAPPLSPPVACTKRPGEVTNNVVEPDVVPEVAVMVTEPAPAPVARPPAAMVATDVLLDAQVTVEVMSAVVLLL